MGIPSFFSYIIKQHNKNVLFNNISHITFSYLCIDANSLIYDVYNKMLKNLPNPSNMGANIEDIIIQEVGKSLDNLIAHINPQIQTYIAFDGICPFAKMKHQRIRRLKGYILRDLPVASVSPPPFTWDTTNITPATNFMNKLTATLMAHYANNPKIEFSGSDIIGEGESKICHYIRDKVAMGANKVAFYGLDNDIIMLSILHLYCTDNIFVFREEIGPIPQFIYINIRALMDSILYEMNCEMSNKSRVIDYVFMCFFLGNDFLPKFPAIQIRSHGITLLLDTYRENIGKYAGRYLVNYQPLMQKGVVVPLINWKWVKLFIQKLAFNEHHFIMIEHEMRNKMEKSLRFGGDVALNNPENAPLLYRQIEQYICPNEPEWNWRYYKALFDVANPTDELIKGWCDNYLEGLEWTFRYYTGDCPDWKWVYHNEYSPLLRDLQLFVPSKYNWQYFPCNIFNPFSGKELLEYVMPPSGQSAEEKSAMMKSVKWKWAYCRYLWESNVCRK